jgi:hypothetical protein
MTRSQIALATGGRTGVVSPRNPICRTLLANLFGAYGISVVDHKSVCMIGGNRFAKLLHGPRSRRVNVSGFTIRKAGRQLKK